MIWLLTTVQQGLLFAATVFFVGCVCWRVFVAPGVSTSLIDARRHMGGLEHQVDQWARRTALVLVTAWVLRMVAQLVAFRDPFAPLRDGLSLLLFQTTWGSVWMAQGIVVLGITMTTWLALPRTPEAHQSSSSLRGGTAWSVLALLACALVTTLAMSGHAMGADAWRAAAVSADALHTLAAGSWIGTLAVILLGATYRASPEVGSSAFGAQIRRFSPIALLSGGALVAMGSVLSWTHLTGVSDLWETTYGRVLSTKIGVVIVILGLGFWNWRRGVPVSDRVEGVRDIRRRGVWEVGLAAVVIALTAILVHSTKP